MKIQLIIAIIFFSLTSLQAQIAIGKEEMTNNSVLLEFGTARKGIIVPQLTNPSNPVAGTFIFDSSDRILKVREASGWKNLTQNSAQGALHTFVNSSPENSQINGVVIGAETSSKPGALVLESTTQAMVLPKVANPQSTMRGSIAGTMVYDTVSGTLAVYDGVNWSYWK